MKMKHLGTWQALNTDGEVLIADLAHKGDRTDAFRQLHWQLVAFPTRGRITLFHEWVQGGCQIREEN